MTTWIPTDEKLPPEGEYVLVVHTRGTWIDEGDPDRVNCVVAKLVRGISHAERTALRAVNDPRASRYHRADEHANNERPYCWDTFGPDSFFGQMISYWMPIPPPPTT